jgi:hypothetical protein
MISKMLLLCMMSLLPLSLGVAGGGDSRTQLQGMQVQIDQPVESVAPVTITPDPLGPNARPLIGNYTTLTGFYDWQSNGGAVQHIQVNPANGNIHVTYMLSDDSAAIGTTRRSGYARSTDDGATWNNYNNVRVPLRSSGYPCLTLLKDAFAGLSAIANHSTIGSTTKSTLFVEFPEGSGEFNEMSAPPDVSLSGVLQPIWPNIGSVSNGSVTMVGSLNTTAAPYYVMRTRTTDFSTWANWSQIPDTVSPGGRYPTYGNDAGYVGTLHNAGNAGGAWWHVSTNGGVSWSASAQNIYPLSPPGRDTRQGNCRIWVGLDFVWDGNIPLMVFNEQTISGTNNNQGRIVFWSQATGFVDIADSANTPGYNYPLNKPQSNHLTMGWPALGKSGSQLVCVWQVMKAETSAAGFNYGDLYYSVSNNNGVTWSPPTNLTNTTTLDERYPSISRWNPPGFIYMTWQEDTQPGSAAFTDNAPLSRTRQVFYKFPIPTVGVGNEAGVANSFKLSQNYPNPFNPATAIDYSVSKAGPVSIKVYNTLGQEVATLLDETLSPGEYSVTFDAGSLASGMYIYRMQAAGYSESKRMLLLK